MADVLVLHQFHEPHHAHRVFGDAVDADYRHFETGNEIGGPEENLDSMLARLRTAIDLESYDIVIGEGTTPIYTLLFYKLLNRWDARIVPLIADETFLKIRDQRTRHLWRSVLGPVASRVVSGAIAVGDLARSWAREYLDVPFEIVHPPIADAKYGVLEPIGRGLESGDPDVENADAPPARPRMDGAGAGASSQPNAEPTRILHAGTVSDRAAVAKKNVDLLARVVASRPDWELRLLGSGHADFEYSDFPGVEALGYLALEDFAAEFDAADLYVQPSSGDAFPVASLEAMLAGLPTVVSTGTGTRELVELVDPLLVRAPSARDIRWGIGYVLSLSPDERRERGAALRERVRPLTEANQAAAFRRSLSEVVA